MWAKLDQPGAVYYDITWTGFCGDRPSDEMLKVYGVVSGARDAAIARVKDAVETGRELRGFEVDDAARGYISSRGYGEYFVHRTGHSIGEDIHGNGANMDNLETHDERRVVPWTCFSIEPGVYLRDFGIRSEVNMFVGETGPESPARCRRSWLFCRGWWRWWGRRYRLPFCFDGTELSPHFQHAKGRAIERNA